MCFCQPSCRSHNARDIGIFLPNYSCHRCFMLFYYSKNYALILLFIAKKSEEYVTEATPSHPYLSFNTSVHTTNVPRKLPGVVEEEEL